MPSSLNLSRPRVFATIFLALLLGVLWALPTSAQDIQGGLDAIAREGGGVYRLPAEKITVRRGVIIPPKVTLDLAGGELVVILTEAGEAGVRLMSNSTLRDGTVSVVSQGTPGTQTGAHAPVLVGALLGENPSVTGLSPYEAPHGWTVSNVILRSDKKVQAGDIPAMGSAAIQVMGGAHHGLIEKVTVPDSSVLSGGIMMDWGIVGSISSADIASSAAQWRRGLAYTTHPHDVTIQHIRIGRLTRPSVRGTGSFGVRLSGVHDVAVQNVLVEETTEAAFYHTAGDLGYEFARVGDRARAHRGIILSGLQAKRAGAYLVRTDSYADNVGRAALAGYRPELAPIAQTDIVVRNVQGAAATPGHGFGVRVDHQRGGRFVDIEVSNFRRGFYIDEQVSELFLVRPLAIDSVEAAVSVEHGRHPPERITIEAPKGVGRSAKSSTIIVGSSKDVRVIGADNAALRVTREAAGLKLD